MFLQLTIFKSGFLPSVLRNIASFVLLELERYLEKRALVSTSTAYMLFFVRGGYIAVTSIVLINLCGKVKRELSLLVTINCDLKSAMAMCWRK